MDENASLIKESKLYNTARPMVWASAELAVWNFGALAFLNVGLLQCICGECKSVLPHSVVGRHHAPH